MSKRKNELDGDLSKLMRFYSYIKHLVTHKSISYSDIKSMYKGKVYRTTIWRDFELLRKMPDVKPDQNNKKILYLDESSFYSSAKKNDGHIIAGHDIDDLIRVIEEAACYGTSILVFLKDKVQDEHSNTNGNNEISKYNDLLCRIIPHGYKKNSSLDTRIREHLRKILEAMKNKKALVIDYENMSGNRATYVMIPYYIIVYDGNIYVLTMAKLFQKEGQNEELDFFKIDRIEKILEEKECIDYDYYIEEKFIPTKEFINKALNPFVTPKAKKNKYKLKILRSFMKPIIEDLERNNINLKITKQGDGELEVEFEAICEIGLSRIIHRWIPYVQVLEPPELVDEIVKNLETALRMHKGQDKVPTTFPSSQPSIE